VRIKSRKIKDSHNFRHLQNIKKSRLNALHAQFAPPQILQFTELATPKEPLPLP
jgi:hypothetical protein